MTRSPCRRSCKRAFLLYGVSSECSQCPVGPWGPNKDKPTIINGIEHPVEPWTPEPDYEEKAEKP